MSQEEIHKTGMYYVIPAQVFEDKRLDHTQIVFYALLCGLAYSTGYCFASNKYLSNRMDRDERTIQRWLDLLEKFGYIEREVIKIGMKTDRKIYITHANSNNSYKRHGCHGRGDNVMVEGDTHVTVDTSPMSPIVSKDILVSEEREAPSQKIQKQKDKIAFTENVKLTQEEYDKLVLEFGLEKVKLYIEKVEQHVATRRGKPYLDDNKTIRGWIKDDENEKSTKATSNQLKPFFDAFKEKYGNHKEIVITTNGVEFLRGNSPSLFASFDENGKSLIVERLKLMGI